MNGFFKVLDINASALIAQRLRMNIISSNMANADTTRTEEGGPYQRKDVRFTTWSPSFEEIMQGAVDPEIKGVRVMEIVDDNRPFRTVYNPSHADANEDGYVTMPNVDPLEEMVNMMAAARSYEANIELFNATKSMLRKIIEIGKF
jgi:flagellar basal-body rod protein FlgC